MRPPLTTHVLDTASGRPAAGLQISLSKQVDGVFQAISCAVTNADGRVDGSLAGDQWGKGCTAFALKQRLISPLRTNPAFIPMQRWCFALRRSTSTTMCRCW